MKSSVYSEKYVLNAACLDSSVNLCCRQVPCSSKVAGSGIPVTPHTKSKKKSKVRVKSNRKSKVQVKSNRKSKVQVKSNRKSRGEFLFKVGTAFWYCGFLYLREVKKARKSMKRKNRVFLMMGMAAAAASPGRAKGGYFVSRLERVVCCVYY